VFELKAKKKNNFIHP